MARRSKTGAGSRKGAQSTRRNDEVLDVAIVGGGVSGVYSGWRLLTAARAESGRLPKVGLFERSGRIGGRLLSVVPPGIPQARVELGGMRYISAHARVARLLHHLGIESVPFPVSEPQNIAYVRGRMLRSRDLRDPDEIPYKLAPDERSPEALADLVAVAAIRALRVILEKDVRLEDVDWKAVIKAGRYNGHRLSDLPLQYLMLRGISEEAFKFAEDTSGYDSILHTWNAADGLPWNLADFGKTVTYFRVKEGYGLVPLMIEERFKKAGGKVHLHHELRSFDEATVVDGKKAIAMRFADGGRTVLARRLILAMPRRALELLDWSGAVLGAENKRVHELIRSVTPIPLFKLAICYPFPWWETIDPVPVKSGNTFESKKITQGESITDLPVRQCYYWAVDEKTRQAAVLIYDDGTDLAFWSGLRNRDAADLFESGGTSPSQGTRLPDWNHYRAPRLMVEEAHRQLVIMHGVQDRGDIPKPYAAAYRDWGEDPYGGGANFWHVRVDSDKVSRAILQPKPPIPVYICGEAYSHFQGWVEGALTTADQVLEMHFGLPAPSWLLP